ncbi:MAG: hypothetical protein JNL12_16665 [Planctomycetes bacterium]|nr:hypothetical protein [Planctomycetota bacterium]
MNLVLTYCWREWRAQRALLGGFVGLGLAALCLAFTLAPESFWRERGMRAFALAWFVVLGGGSVVVFAAPQLVRSEFGSKGDQFVRRMPGALRASFGGKLLFLLLATIALPLLGLVVGQIFLAMHGLGPADVFRSDYAGEVFFDWPSPVVWLGYGALLIPWVWAIGTWLPNGRMALGGTILFVLLLGLGVVPVLRQCPGLEKSLAYGRWCVVVPLLGVVVAAVSWTRGRLGGGALRSARCGLLATAGALGVPGGWLANAAYDYHHPDPQHFGNFETYVLTPDLQFALVRGSSHAEHLASVPFRVDLRDGTAREVGGEDLWLGPEWWQPSAGVRGSARYCSTLETTSPDGASRYRVYDLVSGEWVLEDEGMDAQGLRGRALARLPGAVRTRSASAMRAPGGVPVWFEGDELCFQVAADRVERVHWEGPMPYLLRVHGHGFEFRKASGSGMGWFDLATRTEVEKPEGVTPNVWFVGGVRLWRGWKRGTWLRFERDSVDGVVVPELADAEVIGLLDDECLLVRRFPKQGLELFTWNARTGRVEHVALPFPIGQRSLYGLAPLETYGSLLPRDPAGKLWFATPKPPQHGHDLLLRFDPTTRTWEPLPIPTDDPAFRLLAWPDANSALVQQHDGIDRVDLTTGARTRLFPRRAGGER